MVNDKWQGPFRVYYSGRSTWSDKAMFEQAQPRTGQPREAAQSTYHGSYDVLEVISQHASIDRREHFITWHSCLDSAYPVTEIRLCGRHHG